MRSSFFEERGYLQLLRHTFEWGVEEKDRTGVGTRNVFEPPKIKFSLGGAGTDTARDMFPLLTTKKMPWRSILAETLWFAQGRYDLESLREAGCSWWDPWEKADGTLGRVYGAHLRHWKRTDGSEFDQLAHVINTIKTEPTSRRLGMTMWNPGELEDAALPACHGVWAQFYVMDRKYLSMSVKIRSSDLFLGLPTNIASYALLARMVAQVTGLVADRLVVDIAHAHIYLNHLDQVQEQLSRSWVPPTPSLSLDPDVKNIDDFTMNSFSLYGYDPLPKIPAPVAV